MKTGVNLARMMRGRVKRPGVMSQGVTIGAVTPTADRALTAQVRKVDLGGNHDLIPNPIFWWGRLPRRLKKLNQARRNQCKRASRKRFQSRPLMQMIQLHPQRARIENCSHRL